jgi:putative endopeptidase
VLGPKSENRKQVDLCHAFDKEGKDYDADGNKKKWWSRKDIIAYNKRSKDLVNMYSKEKIHGIHVDGQGTLSENIADIGGVSIALAALNASMDKGVCKEERLTAYRKFFISFATSWRTKYTKKKLEKALRTDVHAPAFTRVNIVVSQFDEWYEAFGITEQNEYYRKPEDRVRIF